MIDWRDFEQLKTFLIALGWTQPRILGMFIPIPVFSRNHLSVMQRSAVAACLGLVVAPMLMPAVQVSELGTAQLVLTLVKEAFVGLILGCLIAVPFWAFEAVGFFIDNQRGASIGATLDPLTGNDSSPLGMLFGLAFIVFFFISGGFLVMLDVLYNSFTLWSVFEWTPHLRADFAPLIIEQILRLVRLALVLAAPAVVAMFLAEMGLAIISRFVPQLQVFFLAMSIKSALVFLVLMMYMATLFEYAGDMFDGWRQLLPLLDGAWTRAPQVPR